MAITAAHVKLFRSLPLPRGGSLLNIGEPNWYGDLPAGDALDCGDGTTLTVAIDDSDLFAVAAMFYEATFSPSRVVSIDLHGTPAALQHDLNRPLPLGGQIFDVVINHGTAEHVFNIVQVFRTMHECCTDGGLMVHESPFTGWIEHGFYNLQPTLFYDLAAANNYEIVLVAIETIEPPTIIRLESREHVSKLATADKLPNNAQLFVAYRKRGYGKFLVPIQGYYAQTLSEAGNRAWLAMR